MRRINTTLTLPENREYQTCKEPQMGFHPNRLSHQSPWLPVVVQNHHPSSLRTTTLVAQNHPNNPLLTRKYEQLRRSICCRRKDKKPVLTLTNTSSCFPTLSRFVTTATDSSTNTLGSSRRTSQLRLSLRREVEVGEQGRQDLRLPHNQLCWSVTPLSGGTGGKASPRQGRVRNDRFAAIPTQIVGIPAAGECRCFPRSMSAEGAQKARQRSSCADISWLCRV
jgi:hypothetical protein